MDTIKKLNKQYVEIINSKEYAWGNIVNLFFNDLKKFDIKNILTNFKKKRKLARAAKLQSNIGKSSQQFIGDAEDNYFLNDRIAIYTCIFGNCDSLREPIIVPDNCDYFVITDSKEDFPDVWIKLDIKIYDDEIKELSNQDKNRYFKMHPERLFKDYKYSVYMDGCCQVMGDLTALINRIGKYGLAVHLHSSRDCVYEEAKIILALGKDCKDNIKKLLKYLNTLNYPEHYGLLECGVIAREHHNPICKKIMEMWWNDYCKMSKRDQLSLPPILFKNNISVEEIGVLGANLRQNYLFHFGSHRTPEI